MNPKLDTFTLTYHIHTVMPYINWIYFFHAWGFPPRFAAIADIHGCDSCRASWLSTFPETERARAAEAMQLHKDAIRMLNLLDEDFHTYVRFGLYEANADGNDLLLFDNAGQRSMRLPLLRQQQVRHDGGPCLCLSDFVRPIHKGERDIVGVFAGTVDSEIEHLYEEGNHADEFKHLLCQTLADRLAEASVEKMHEEVRKNYWGYSPDEQFTPKELFRESYPGIRPAVGYPSLPDQSTNFELNTWLDFSAIGIRLTETGAMLPHASVSGLILAHPQAHYFAIGKIGEDQLVNYAQRKGKTPDEIRKYLTANL